jgi:hypothetical protein
MTPETVTTPAWLCVLQAVALLAMFTLMILAMYAVSLVLPVLPL